MDQLTLQEHLVITLKLLEKYQQQICRTEDAYDLEVTVRKLADQLMSLQLLDSIKGSNDDVSFCIQLLNKVDERTKESLELGFELEGAAQIVHYSNMAYNALSKVTLGDLSLN
ncbi:MULTISPECIES: hypothetical protein [Vibrio]|uniref:hypothetical protein n=1 Tax=Vibrio TaxID=662 RepID=UPI003D1394B8